MIIHHTDFESVPTAMKTNAFSGASLTETYKLSPCYLPVPWARRGEA